MTQKIEVTLRSNVPMPPKIATGGRPRQSKYPFAEMEVGQMFEMPADKQKALRGAISAFHRKYDKRKLAMRLMPGGATVGVWRLK